MYVYIGIIYACFICFTFFLIEVTCLSLQYKSNVYSVCYELTCLKRDSDSKFLIPRSCEELQLDLVRLYCSTNRSLPHYHPQRYQQLILDHVPHILDLAIKTPAGCKQPALYGLGKITITN